VATLRQARRTWEPDPVWAAVEAHLGGADGITVHLREDRRHIQERDIHLLAQTLQTRMNLEMALTEEMLQLAEAIRPAHVCLVPEKREELTTEGGLNVVGQEAQIRAACMRLADAGCEVSLFIDPDLAQIDAAVRCGAPVIELHTGNYADASTIVERSEELERLKTAARHAWQQGLVINAGHGLHYHNVEPVAEIPELNELNIGHGIIARALMVGLKPAVAEMRQLLMDVQQRVQSRRDALRS
jgi:pyridoxine 5-phosphate synthase